ncbi:MAG: MBL fold metallo-hydrolase [Clostridia bacterium]|nr:MBL fold metallo-hydrolase [Clostridia bacterium]
MLENVEVFCHNSIKICGSKVIYIDPFKLEKDFHDADYIFSTHTHYDHFSEEDIEKLLKKDTIIITPDSSRELACDLTRDRERVVIVEPDKEYDVKGVKFATTYAYNKETLYHTKKENWVGYIIELDGVKYYIAGDTDNIKELHNVECDVAFIPVGGKYTMGYEEAADLANTIKAKIVVPTHYGSIVGTKEDAEKFANLVRDKEVKILIK